MVRSQAELRDLIQRKFNPGQLRVEGGEHGGEWASAGGPGGALKDALKLAGKIGLDPDEKLVGSAKIDGDGGIRMALTERGGVRTLRLGLGGEDYGKPNRDMGIPAWDGNPPREALPKAEYDRLDAEFDALDDEYDTATPERKEEISNRQDDIRELLGAGDEEFNGTAKLDEYGMRRLADKIGPALAEAVDEAKREAKAWDEIDALTAKGNPDPQRMADLRRIARADDTDFITFDEGIIPGSDWGDVHYSVLLDELDPVIRLGVKPKGAPDDWGDGENWQGQFDAGEVRKFLRQLDQYSGSAERSRKGGNPVDQDALRARDTSQGATYTAPASSQPKGGQFALGGGRVSASGRKTTPRRPSRGPSKPSAPAGPLSFDGKRGTGYGIKGGDPRVRTLQSALNRLGLTDSSGAALVLDGKYGPRTTSSVKKLQKALGLTADGKVTPELLKQVSELKQLPPKKSTTPKAPVKRSAAPHRHVLDNGICVTCNPDALDEASQALLDAITEIADRH